MNKISPATEFTLSLFYFTVDPKDAKARERLGVAIDAWRAARWLGAGIYTKQLVTAADRALSAAPVDLEKALAGIAEIQKLAGEERSMEGQAELERARSARKREARSGGGQVQQSPEAAPEPPHTPWDERRDRADQHGPDRDHRQRARAVQGRRRRGAQLMGKGIDLARIDGPEHAALMEELKEQLLIAFLRRLGGDVIMPVSEVDATGDWLLSFSLDVQMKTFHFKCDRKQ